MQVFEWDQNKAHANAHNHAVTFDEAATVFLDPLALTVPDLFHSEDEDRSLEIGMSALGRLLMVVYTARGQVIRIISARKATKTERKTYEEENL